MVLEFNSIVDGDRQQDVMRTLQMHRQREQMQRQQEQQEQREQMQEQREKAAKIND